MKRNDYYGEINLKFDSREKRFKNKLSREMKKRYQL